MIEALYERGALAARLEIRMRQVNARHQLILVVGRGAPPTWLATAVVEIDRVGDGVRRQEDRLPEHSRPGMPVVGNRTATGEGASSPTLASLARARVSS